MYINNKNYKYLFGPVPSRRLGRSLGVDIIPHKICTLNCIYCEVGRTTSCTSERKSFYNPDDIIAELKENYPQLAGGLDVITVTGAGEPTLSKDLGYIIDEIKKFSKLPVAVLTNSTLFTDRQVQNELLNADIVVPSVDAASEDVYRKICAPERSLKISEINSAVVEFSQRYSGRLLIEILLCEGINDSQEEIALIADVIEKCRYDIVQLNTVHRPPAFSRAKTVSPETLLNIALYLKSRGIKVEPVGNYLKDFSGGSMTQSELARLLSMRPCSLKDISLVFGVSAQEAEAVLKNIETEAREVNGEIFYFIPQPKK